MMRCRRIAWMQTVLAVALFAATGRGEDLDQLAGWFEKKGAELVNRAARTVTNGVELVVYRPQTSDFYDGTWLRDYEMMVEARLIDESRLRPCAKLFFDAVTPDGVGVDNIRYDGEVVFIPRQKPRRSIRPVLDGSVYTVCLIYETWKQTGDGRYLEPATLDKLAKCLAATPHDPKNGLAWIDPAIEWERCPWGFTDTVRKKGDCLYTSLLEIRARRSFADMLRAAGRAAESLRELEASRRLSAAVNEVFWDEPFGLYRAATALCTQRDVWGSAYAVWLDVAPAARADRIARYFRDHYGEIVQCGQIRQMPAGEWWDQTLLGRKDFCQNGPFWGTATGWFCWALERVDPGLVDRTYNDLVTDYRTRGVCEWSIGDHVSNCDYLANVALPLQGLRRIIAARRLKSGEKGDRIP